MVIEIYKPAGDLQRFRRYRIFHYLRDEIGAAPQGKVIFGAQPERFVVRLRHGLADQRQILICQFRQIRNFGRVAVEHGHYALTAGIYAIFQFAAEFQHFQQMLRGAGVIIAIRIPPAAHGVERTAAIAHHNQHTAATHPQR